MVNDGINPRRDSESGRDRSLGYELFGWRRERSRAPWGSALLLNVAVKALLLVLGPGLLNRPLHFRKGPHFTVITVALPVATEFLHDGTYTESS